MHIWVLLYFIVPCYSMGIPIRETEYECGAHGRFEYCIDGVPGCVIGCHCHPGYYFDTDSKICEPNIRLTQNFRRNYEILEPTRVPSTPAVLEEPATTVVNEVDEKIDIITKDADDLGDWLYNQFFKTIENRVINETKDDSVLTRRSDNFPTFVKKPTRRSHKRWKTKRRKKKKKKGLRSKLLRITEDDSLFNSDSGSSSDDSSSDSDSSSSSTSEEAKDKHDHKKLLVYNKRPKPPLPSFIFLPNMDTPFFPPIGLPPPVMPMYPMVPVPPMMGPFPFPVTTTLPPNNTTTDAGTLPPDKTTVPDITQTKKTLNSKPNDNISNEEEKTPVDDNLQEKNVPANNENDATEALLRSWPKKRRGNRNKLAQKLRDKLKKKNKLENYFANEYQEPPMGQPGMNPNFLANFRPKTLPEINVEEELAGLHDVDFKYLSQLIHRADLNRTNQNAATPITTSISTQLKHNELSVPLATRRDNSNSQPYEITQVLSDLANQPLNQIPNSAIYNPINQNSFNILNQSTHNMLTPSHYNGPNYPTHSASNPPNANFPAHPNNNVPYPLSYNLPNPTAYNLPNSHTYNMPNPSDYNVPNKLKNNTPDQLNRLLPNQVNNNAHNQLYLYNNPSYNVPKQLNNIDRPSYVSLNEPYKNPYRNKIENSNDLYYSNLGRQIASMIRNIDGDKEVNIEIKSDGDNLENQMIPERSGSKSYWERSVRSPFTRNMKSYKKAIEHLKSSNENLFSLENKVFVAASTIPTLSLHELENIISKMHKTKSKLINSSLHTTHSSKYSFNVNLLPKYDQHANKQVNKRDHNFVPYKSKNISITSNNNTQDVSSPLQAAPIRTPLLPDFEFTLQTYDEILNKTTSKANLQHTNINVPRRLPTRTADSATTSQIVYKIPNPYIKTFSYTITPFMVKQSLSRNMQPPVMPTTTSRTYYQQLSPMLLNHKAVQYYDGMNNNQYIYAKSSIPFRPQLFPSHPAAPMSRYEHFPKRIQPSYFHHEVHHFDYFDDFL